MFWHRKSKKPECFSWQKLTEEEKERLIQCVKDEFKELVQTGDKVDRMLNNLQWVNLCSGDKFVFKYSFELNLPTLRLMLRGAKDK